jgi:hypothetical protein
MADPEKLLKPGSKPGRRRTPTLFYDLAECWTPDDVRGLIKRHQWEVSRGVLPEPGPFAQLLGEARHMRHAVAWFEQHEGPHSERLPYLRNPAFSLEAKARSVTPDLLDCERATADPPPNRRAGDSHELPMEELSREVSWGIASNYDLQVSAGSGRGLKMNIRAKTFAAAAWLDILHATADQRKFDACRRCGRRFDLAGVDRRETRKYCSDSCRVLSQSRGASQPSPSSVDPSD